jgi:hypothetical protein
VHGLAEKLAFLVNQRINFAVPLTVPFQEKRCLNIRCFGLTDRFSWINNLTSSFTRLRTANVHIFVGILKVFQQPYPDM